MKIEAILFDVIGTTVKERVPGTISLCMQSAFENNGVVVDKSVIDQNRGKDKVEMINNVLDSCNFSRQKSLPIFEDFKERVKDSFNNFAPMENVVEVFDTVKRNGIKLGIGSGLPKDLFDELLLYLQWGKETFHYIGVSSELGKTRPDPAMILDMIKSLKLQGGSNFLKVGDTVADVMEGKNADVKTAAVLSGTQTASKLSEANPDYLLDKIEEVLTLMKY